MDTLSHALVILGAAGVVIPAFARFRISPIIGFILVGIAVGPWGLGRMVGAYPWVRHVTISAVEEIELFGEFGIILLLFSIGLELSFPRLWRMRRLVFGVGATELLGSGAIFAAIFVVLGIYAPVAAMGLGVALALSSTALVLPITGTSSAVGRAALSMLLFEDLAIVPIIFILGALSPQATSGGWDGLVTILWQGAVVTAILVAAGRWLLPHIFAQAARAKSPEIFLAASLLVVIIAALATGVVGLSPIFGAILAGVMIAESDYYTEVEAIIAPFKGLALGVFLITIGMGLNLSAMAQLWPQVLGAVVGVVLVKAVVTALLLRMAGARRGTAVEAGVLMGSPSETTLIVLAAALAAGWIGDGTAEFWQLVTAVGLTITPLLAQAGHHIARSIELRDSEETPVEMGSQSTIIIGFGRIGRTVADLMQKHNCAYIAVDANIDQVAAARRAGYNVRFADMARAGAFARFDMAKAQAIVMTMDNPVQQLRLVRKLRQAYPNLPIITRARDIDYATDLYTAGAQDAVLETFEGSLHLAEAVLIELGIAMGPVLASIHDTRTHMYQDIKERRLPTPKEKIASKNTDKTNLNRAKSESG